MSIEEIDKQIDKALSGWKTPTKRDKDAIWVSITNSIDSKPLNIINTWRWVAAACIIVMVGSFALFSNANVQYSTNHSEKLSVVLPDESTVTINEDSKVAYNSISWMFGRSISLSGEAFFKVKKGSQFKVETNNGVVKVLGTSFNVTSRENSFMVDCFTGKVEVANSSNKVVLTAGEKMLQGENRTLEKELFNSDLKSPLWIVDNHSYTKTKLNSVFLDIAKEYDITIDASDKVNKLKFTGEWNNGMELADVLKIVCLPFNLEAKLVETNSYRILPIEQQ